jgi:diguanylate cyclase (GGDEF)-like protein
MQSHILRRATTLGSGHDLIARYGGEEFAVFLPGLPPRSAVTVAQRLRASIAHAHDSMALTASIGVAHCPEHGATVVDLLGAADAALYEAKHDGRNAVRVATSRSWSVPS